MAVKSTCYQYTSISAFLVLLVTGMLPLVPAQVQNTPVISVWGNNNRRFTGQRLTLFCKVSNFEGYSYSVKWIKGFTLTDGTRVMYSDGGRIRVSRWLTGVDEEVYVLTVSDVTRDYRGDMKCQVVYFVADAKQSKLKTYSVQIIRSMGQLLPSCSANAGKTGYLAIEANTNVQLTCSANTLHENATLTWTISDVFGTMNVLENSMILEETDVQSTLDFTLDQSYNGALFICTFSPEGNGNNRDCTVGPIRVSGVTTTIGPIRVSGVTTTIGPIKVSGVTTTDRIASTTRPPVTLTQRETVPSEANLITSVAGQRTTVTYHTSTRNPTATTTTTFTPSTRTTITASPTTNEVTASTNRNDKSTASVMNSQISTLMSYLSTKYNTIYSSAITTIEPLSHSVNRGQSSLAPLRTKSRATTKPSHVPMTTQHYRMLSTHPSMTKLETPPIINTGAANHQSMTPSSSMSQTRTIHQSVSSTSETITMIAFITKETKDIFPTVKNGIIAHKVSLDPTTVKATLLSCVTFLVLLFIIVMCVSFCVSPNQNSTGKSTRPSSFCMVSMDKSPLHSSVQSSHCSSDVSSNISGKKVDLTQPYHVTNLMTNQRRNPEIIYDNNCLQNGSHVNINNRRLNDTNVLYDNRTPSAAEVVYDNRTSKIVDKHRRNNDMFSDVIYDNRKTKLATENLIQIETNSTMETLNEELFDDDYSQYTTDDSMYDEEDSNPDPEVLYDNNQMQTSSGVSSDHHRPKTDVVYDNRRGAANQNGNTISSADYAEITPLCDAASDGHDGDDEHEELDFGIYNATNICIAIDEAIKDVFHVNHALDNPLYDIDT